MLIFSAAYLKHVQRMSLNIWNFKNLTNSVICALIVKKKKNIMTGKQFIRKFRMKIFSGDVRAINY